MGDESTSCCPCIQPTLAAAKTHCILPSMPRRFSVLAFGNHSVGTPRGSPTHQADLLPASQATNPPPAARAHSLPPMQQGRAALSCFCPSDSPRRHLGITPSAHHATPPLAKRTCSPRHRRRILQLLPAHIAAPHLHRTLHLRPLRPATAKTLGASARQTDLLLRVTATNPPAATRAHSRPPPQQRLAAPPLANWTSSPHYG